MAGRRLTRVNALLRREIADLLFRIMNDAGFDPLAVTVTRVEATNNLRQARVFCSVRGTAEDKQRILRQLLGHRRQLQQAVSRDVVLKYTPHLSFHLDESIHQGDAVLELLDGLGPVDPDGTPEDA
jgi:ribosome-binding factor A